ncbi:MAG: polysaccharide deacetylase family protein [Oscillospiraceae bacterium]|nr:polysaccharide deacetylase family protein [Oscillospiraceae bacterium]
MTRKKWILLILCSLLAVAGILTAVFFAGREKTDYQMNMQLNGDSVITIEFGEVYTDPGASAMLLDRESGAAEAAKVTVSGNVNTQVLGTYTVRYAATKGDALGTIYRRVQVVDTQAPTIELVADPEYYTLPGQPYQEEGFTATDNYDGDITDCVHRTENNGTVTYTVKDSFGNVTTVTRDIVYNDPIAPELTLQGEEMVIIEVGDDYAEPGYTATDNCDGDLTDSVQIGGSVNTFKTGRYILTYTVSDSYENTVEATRTVFVKDRKVEHVNDPNKGDKVIYLTFDDGPGAHTDRLLDILAKYNVQATFFVVNTGYISTVKRIAEEGHAVAIHTATHNFKQIYASEDAYFDDLYKMQGIIEKYTGITTNLIRFPGGSSNTVSSSNKGIMTRLTKLVEDVGFVYFDWNVDSMDAGGAKTAKKVYENVIKGVSGKTNSVVLMHDIKSYTVDAIEKIIVWGLENGYTFRALDENSPTCHHRVNN